MLLKTAKQKFLVDLEHKYGRSAKTIENYDRYLSRFLGFVPVKQTGELTEAHINKFKLYLGVQAGTKVRGKTESMKPKTQNFYLIALRTFLKWLRQREIVAVLPERIKLTKTHPRLPDLIPSTDLDKLLSTPPSATLVGKRDRAILHLLVSTGLRVSELCGLEILDIDLKGEVVKVGARGDKVRTSHLTERAKTALVNYMTARQDKERALFIRYGKKAHVGEEVRISPRTVQRLLNDYAVKAGITGKLTPQIIRNSFATSLLNQGTDLTSVQILLGHANISTTKVFDQLK